ncbi:MAG: sulfur carrier protein ThiS [Candidatus Sulfotelmatobacter sp.]
MNLHINGEPRTFPDPAPPAEFTLVTLIESLNMKSDRVAVELNREIAPRDRWPQTILKDGDRLEIVHFVGGGRPAQPPIGLSSRARRGTLVP